MGATAPADVVRVVKPFELLFKSLKDGELLGESEMRELVGALLWEVPKEPLKEVLNELSKVLASSRLLDGSAGV